MKYTDNYGLKKPELNDYVNIEDFNENADIIDKKLKNVTNDQQATKTEFDAHKADYANPHNVTSAQVNRLGLNAFTQDAPMSDYDLGVTMFYTSKEKWPIIGSAGSGLSRGVVETLKTVSPSWGIQILTEHGNTGSSSIIGDVWVRGIGTNSSGVAWGPWRRILTQDDYDDFIAHQSDESIHFQKTDVTKSDVGLGNVINERQATKTEFDAHQAEVATQEQLGHVKAGNNITIDADGTINAKGGNVDSVNGKTGEVVIDVRDIAGLVSSELALGAEASAAGDFSVALSSLASAAGDLSVALGADTSAEEFSSIALGAEASAKGFSSVALGRGVSAENANEGILGGIASSSPKKWKVPGDFTVSGTKNFEIPHPKPEKSATHVIRHGAVESPTPGDTLYRWRVQASKDNDLVTIDLPDYFVWLNTNVQIFVTPQGHFGNGYGVLNRETEQLEIHCQYEGEYNVLVIGTRNDDHPSVQEWSIKGVEREVGESWTGESYAFSVDEIIEVEEIKEVS